MRLLMVGVTSIRYVRENWIEPMSKMYELTYVAYDTLFRAMGLTRLENYIADICKEGYDYVFFYPDGRGQMFSDNLFKLLKDERKIVFHSDDAGGVWYQNCSRFDYRYDFIATSAKEGYIKRINSNSYKGNAIYVPWGYNPEIYYKIDNEDKDTDVVFLGSNFEKDGLYFHDGEYRQSLLTKLYEASIKYGFSFRIYGAGWDRHPVLKNCYEGFAEAETINRMFNRTRIILGLGYSIDKEPTYQTKLKHFENSGTGSFQLVNYNPELEEIFGNSLGYFTDAEDMVNQVLYYLNNPGVREKKAADAYRICVKECTMSARIRELFSKADDYFAHSSDMTKNCKNIIINHIKPDELDNLADAEDDEYCCISDEITCFDWNETVIPTDIRTGNETPDVFSVNSYVTFCDPVELEESRIIRRSGGPDTVVIPPSFDNGGIPYDDEIKKHFTCIENDGKFFPLCNYIFKNSYIKRFLDDIKKGNVSCLIDAYRTDRICGDYIIADETPVNKRYDNFFDKVFGKNKSVVIYGLSGYAFDMYSKWISKRGIPQNVLYVDRNLAGKEKDGIMCIDLDTLLHKKDKPDAILIMAIFSAEEIYKSLEPLKNDSKIIKMYEMKAFN